MNGDRLYFVCLPKGFPKHLFMVPYGTEKNGFKDHEQWITRQFQDTERTFSSKVLD